MTPKLIILVCCAAAILVASGAEGAATPETIHVVLLGATGNLAKKYLFQALFNKITEEGATPAAADGQAPASHIVVWPAATKGADVGQPIIDATVAGNVTCKAPADGASSYCASAESAFQERVQPYSKLRKDGDFAALAQKIDAYDAARGQPAAGRLFYLSIPPKFYGGVAARINAHVRPSGASGGGAKPWLRVVCEKPFGADVASAEALASELRASLSLGSGGGPQEVLVVDHYLGKAGVQAIADLRLANRAWLEPLLGQAAAVEVAMKETEDCEGRTGYYDSYGVVRDVMQNHLIEMAALLAMELPTAQATRVSEALSTAEGKAAWETRKLALLGRLRPAAGSRQRHGQYAGYLGHVRADRAAWAKPGDESWREATTDTSTCGAVTLELGPEAMGGWAGVPIRLTAGKGFAARTAYARVQVRGSGEEGAKGELVFRVQGGKGGGGGPAILASGAVAAAMTGTSGHAFAVPSGWALVRSCGEPACAVEAAAKDGYDPEWMVVVAPTEKPMKAYEVVVRAALDGRTDLFVSSASAVLAWKAIDPVIRSLEADSPASYTVGEAAAVCFHEDVYGTTKTSKEDPEAAGGEREL